MQRTKSRKANNSFNVLCLDPSLTAFGYVVMQENTILTQGCIKTETGYKKLRIRKGDDRMRRISEINQVLKSVIETYNVKYIVSELPHGSQSAVAAIALGLVNGAVQAMADFLNIGLEWYSEGDAKKAILGKNSASKKEIIERINKLYEVEWFKAKYKNEAIADSLAIHYVAMQQSSVLKLML